MDNAPTTAPGTLIEGSDLSFGQRAVGLTFNPSGDEAVHNCKLGFAALIDQMHDLRATSDSPEQCRHASVAITELESAQMRAVKALTWRA